MKFSSPTGVASAPIRISRFAWGFLLLSFVAFLLTLLLVSLNFDGYNPGLLNPLVMRTLPERWQVSDNLFEVLVPTIFCAFAAFVVKVLPRRPWSYAIALLLLSGFGLRYLAWRSTTINSSHPLSFVLSGILFLCEATYLVTTTLQFYPSLLFDPLRRSRQADKLESWPIDTQAAVDIWIPTYNEAARLIRRAVITCKNLSYANKIITILDDGHRPEIAELARELDVSYLTRPDNSHRKAGNLNYALAHTSCEFIAIFDCDFMPFPTFLNRTLGFFNDPGIALVQTPQHYFNSDFHNRNLGLECVMPTDMDSFFHYLQVVRDRFNTVICCGTSYVVRRSALESIGGYVTSCLIEDHQTGTKLITNGWQMVYLDEILSVGEVPRTFRDYLDQRLRWMQGNFQIYYRGEELPIWSRLGFWQKGFYVNLLFSLFTPFFRAAYIILPLASFLIGFTLIAAPPIEYLAYGVPFLILMYSLPTWLSRDHHFQFWNEVYESLFCFPALVRIFQILRQPFGIIGSIVTNKDYKINRQTLDLRLAWPFIAYLAVLFVALLLRYALPLLHVDHYRSPFEGEALMVAWTLYNGFLIFICLLSCIDQPVRRQADRFPLDQVCRLNVAGKDFWGVSTDFSENGVGLVLTDKECLLASDHGVLEVVQQNIQIPVIIKRQGIQDGHPVIGMLFEYQDAKLEAALIQLIYSESNQYIRLPRIGTVDSLLALLGTVWNAAPLLRRYS